MMVHAVAHSNIGLEKKVMLGGTVEGALKQVTSHEIYPEPVIVMRAGGRFRKLGMGAQPEQIRTDESVKRPFNLDAKVDKGNESIGTLQ